MNMTVAVWRDAAGKTRGAILPDMLASDVVSDLAGLKKLFQMKRIINGTEKMRR